MNEITIQIIDKYGYLAILVLIAIENIFPPIPSEVILTFSGFMTTYTNMNIIGVILCATIGSIIGAFILYKIGFILTEERIYKMLEYKLFYRMGFKKKDVFKAINWFGRRGKMAVLVGRCIPVVRSLISIPAGISRMKRGEFLLYTAVGTLIWNTILVALGNFVGESWESIIIYCKEYSIVIFLVLILGIVLLSILKRKKSYR